MKIDHRHGPSTYSKLQSCVELERSSPYCYAACSREALVGDPCCLGRRSFIRTRCNHEKMARPLLPTTLLTCHHHKPKIRKMSALTACASCNTTEKLKHCSRCKTVVYCSPACQRAHWQTHKPSCHFKVVSLPSNQATSNDALSALRTMPDPVTQQKRKDVSAVAQQTFNIPELRLAIFSLLPARDLLRVQRVCRSWYLTIASERKLQQRMFFTAGPGELIIPARKGRSTTTRCRD